MELDFVAHGWQGPPEELQVIPEATVSSAEARQCHQGHASPKRRGMSVPRIKGSVGKEVCA